MRVQGHVIAVDPDPRRGTPGTVEYDTRTCVHCQRVLFLKPGSGGTVYFTFARGGAVHETLGAWCGRCAAPICLACERRGTCVPFEEAIRRYEARAALRACVAGAGGG